MKVAIPREIRAGERRVALVPDVVKKLSDYEIAIESGAGAGAHIPDAAYTEVGATVADGSVLSDADVVVKVAPPTRNEELGAHEVELMREGALLLGFLDPLMSPDLVGLLADRRITAFGMETIPRISRAQRMDALSSQATVAGYAAALIGARTLPKFFPMLMTAAGTVPPSKVFVLGAGVAGLQAIATSRRLGAVVEAFDIRPAVKEEVESLGAKFVAVELEESAEDEGGYAKELSEEAERREKELVHEHVVAADVVITTAAVPGKRAPLLVTEAMVREMRPGSVIVDLAAATGGNCELTEPDAEIVRHDVTIHGPLNLPSSMAVHASNMYARNVSSLLQHLAPEGELRLDFDDEITAGACITHDGRIVNERVRATVEAT